MSYKYEKHHHATIEMERQKLVARWSKDRLRDRVEKLNTQFHRDFSWWRNLQSPDPTKWQVGLRVTKDLTLIEHPDVFPSETLKAQLMLIL